MKTFKWKLVNKKGRLISKHYTKKNAEEQQRRSGKVKCYVRKI